MTDADHIRTLLTDLVDIPVPVDIDVDRQMERGERRRRARIALSGLIGATAVAVAVGSALSFVPTTNSAPSATSPDTSPTPTRVWTAQTPPPGHVVRADAQRSTPKSRALSALMPGLFPEIGQRPGGRPYDLQYFVDGQALRWQTANVSWTDPERSSTIVALDIGTRQDLPPGCYGLADPANPPENLEEGRIEQNQRGGPACTEIRRLPDGATASIVDLAAGPKFDPDPTDAVGHLVTVDRADGIRVKIDTRGIGAPAPVTLERALAAALQIRFTP